MIKKVMMIAVLLIVVGLTGSLFTYQSISKADDITENKVIQEAFDEIKIMSNEASVEVLPTDDSKAKIELSSKSSNYHFAADVEQSVLNVKVDYRQKKLFNFDFTSAHVSLKVYVPEKEYKLLQIKSDNGSIQAHDLQAKDTYAETDNGRIKLSNMNAEKVTATADNGSLDLKNVIALVVETKTNNGKVNLDKVDGQIVGKANNGSIVFKTEELNRSIDFETDNGKITIQSEKEPTNAILDIQVDNGKVDYFGKSNWDTVIGDGEHVIKLTTKNGKITLEK